MANLSNLIKKYQYADVDETNLERGKIWYYAPTTDNANSFVNREIYWYARRNGTAIIEAWGAAGSPGGRCCCGIGLPANPPAYVKKTIRTDKDTWIKACIGKSCAATSACCTGQGVATCIAMCSPNGLLDTADSNFHCLCAEGGNTGFTWFINSSCPIGCFINSGYYATPSNGCGVVCNYGASAALDKLARAFGGDVNCNGEFSCLTIGACCMGWTCWMCNNSHIRTAAGLWGPQPQTINVNHTCQTWAGGCNQDDGLRNLMAMTMSMAQHPVYGGPLLHCTGSNNFCRCRIWIACGTSLGHGIPGMIGNLTCNTCTWGLRGGHGAMRIRFIADKCNHWPAVGGFGDHGACVS